MTDRRSKSKSQSLYAALVRAVPSSARARACAVGCASAVGLHLGSASTAHAGGTLPMALTSYLDTSANVAHVFYQGTDGGVYDLSAPLSQAAQGTYSCSQPLPSMKYWMQSRTWDVVPGAATPGGGLASGFDGTTGYLYFIGSDGGVWGASGNPPTAVTATSLNAAAGSSAVMPAGVPQRWVVPGARGMAPVGYLGVTSSATLAAAVAPGQQWIFYQGTTGTNLRYLVNAPFTTGGWFASSLGAAAPKALDGRGLAATWLPAGPALIYDDAAGDAEVFSYGCTVTGNLGMCRFVPQDTLNFEFQGFLAAASIYDGSSGLEVIGPDQSVTVPTIDTANNANATGAWTNGGVQVPVVQSGPSVLLSTGSSATAPNGQSSWLYFVGADGLIYSSSDGLLTPPHVCLPACDGNPAESTSNTPFSPLTGFYSPLDANVYLFYLDSWGTVFQIVISQGSARKLDVRTGITPSICPQAMN
jgi:hypothetical protein